MDGDYFSTAIRLGRAVAEAVVTAASEGTPFDGFTAVRLIDHFIESSGGIAALPPVLEILEDLRATPLLIPTRIEEGCARVEAAAHRSDCGTLDLLLSKVVQSAINRGETEPSVILEAFTRSLIERYVIMGRGGLVDFDGLRYVERARELTGPMARAAAAELLRRPRAQRLGLARGYRITADSNLLAGP